MTVDTPTFTCPVCGYPELDGPPHAGSGQGSYDICPCCGIEFGNDDFGISHAELRTQWIEKCMPWWSTRIQKPANWDGTEQLRTAQGNWNALGNLFGYGYDWRSKPAGDTFPSPSFRKEGNLKLCLPVSGRWQGTSWSGLTSVAPFLFLWERGCGKGLPSPVSFVSSPAGKGEPHSQARLVSPYKPLCRLPSHPAPRPIAA